MGLADVPAGIVGALRAYDPDLDCVWDERSGIQKITWRGKTVLAIVEPETLVPRQVTLEDVRIVIKSDSHHVSAAEQVRRMEMSEAAHEQRVEVVQADNAGHYFDEVWNTGHKVISRERHGGAHRWLPKVLSMFRRKPSIVGGRG